MTEAEKYAYVDELIEEYNKHKRAIEIAQDVADTMKARRMEQIDKWLAWTVKTEQDALDQITPLLSDALLKITAHSEKKSIKLPSGTAGFRAQPIKYYYKGEAVNPSDPDFVKVIRAIDPDGHYFVNHPKLDWAALKAELRIAEDSRVVTQNGEAISEMTAQRQPDKLYVSAAKE